MEMIELLTGPVGGVIALAFGLGATSGYGFATRTVMAEAKSRIAALEAKVERLQAEYIDEIKSK